MRYGDEQAQVMEWAWGVLSQDQGLADALGVPLEGLPDRVWPDTAPGGTEPPWVVYSAGEARDVLGVGRAARVYTVVPLNARVVHRAGDPGAASAAVRRLYALLHGTSATPVSEGGTVLSSTREVALNYPEDVGGIQYRHTGGLFRVEVN